MSERAHDNETIDIGLEAAFAKRQTYSSAGLAGSAADRMAELTGRPWKHVFCPPAVGVPRFRIEAVR